MKNRTKINNRLISLHLYWCSKSGFSILSAPSWPCFQVPNFSWSPAISNVVEFEQSIFLCLVGKPNLFYGKCYVMGIFLNKCQKEGRRRIIKSKNWLCCSLPLLFCWTPQSLSFLNILMGDKLVAFFQKMFLSSSHVRIKPPRSLRSGG